MSTLDSTADKFPEALRAEPQRFVGSLDRSGLYLLRDNLLRSLLWGSGPEAAELHIQVEPDGTLDLSRPRWSTERLFASLPGSVRPPEGRSLAAHHFARCVQALREGRPEKLDWVPGNPRIALFLAIAVALATRSRLEFTEEGLHLAQSYVEGRPEGPVEVSEGDGTGVTASFDFDRGLFGQGISAYPYRVRLREMAALIPSSTIHLKYKSYQPFRYEMPGGVADLLREMVPADDRCHRNPFQFRFERDGLDFRCAVFLVTSQMERFKSFAMLDEASYGGVHERLVRQALREGLTASCRGVAVPVRRQSWDSVATSRASYYGKFGRSLPYIRDARKTGEVRTLPGVAAVIAVRAPVIEWETALRTRVTGIPMAGEVRARLAREFRSWISDHPDVATAWAEQWRPRRRGPRR